MAPQTSLRQSPGSRRMSASEATRGGCFPPRVGPVPVLTQRRRSAPGVQSARYLGKVVKVTWGMIQSVSTLLCSVLQRETKCVIISERPRKRQERPAIRA